MYLMKLKEGSAAYTYWLSNASNTFNKYFVAFYPVRDVLLVQLHGRPVCSTDMGHFKHQLFDGMNATGITTCIINYVCTTHIWVFYVFVLSRVRFHLLTTNRLVPDG
jgi:hypothetical protein